MIAALWWWLATPITLSRAPIDPAAKLQCVSYAPFRGAQTPLVPTTQISPEQIAADLAQLAKITDCVRTYSIEIGLDQVPALAAKVGLKVIQGIWLSSNRIKNLAQIAIAVELTKEHPGTIIALVVGNEVLLAAGIASPLLCANAAMSGRPLPTLLDLLGPRDYRTKSVLAALLGFVLVVTTVIAAQTALGFTFDPRYRDFPFASLTMAVVPFAALMLLNRPKEGVRPIAESTFAGLLVAGALFMGFNEGDQNWQSMWTCAVYLLLAFTLWRARAVQNPG